MHESIDPGTRPALAEMDLFVNSCTKCSGQLFESMYVPVFVHVGMCSQSDMYMCWCAYAIRQLQAPCWPQDTPGQMEL